MKSASAQQFNADIAKVEKPLFETIYRVEERDLDELNHANNVSYVRWLQHVTARHNSAFGLSQDFLLSTKIVFVVIDYTLKYLRPCKLGDELILKTCVSDFNRFSHTRFYEVANLKDDAVLLRGSGRWVSMDLRTEKLTRMPDVHFGRMAAMADQTQPDFELAH